VALSNRLNYFFLSGSHPLKPVVQFRLRITKADNIAIGPGKVALLEAIVDTGSITAAAKALGMSYRRAWLLIDSMNQMFKSPVVDAATGGKHGGGANVTSTGLKVIECYRRIEQDALKAGVRDINKIKTFLHD
jgi:molybdate transport system regulatory protein